MFSLTLSPFKRLEYTYSNYTLILLQNARFSFTRVSRIRQILETKIKINFPKSYQLKRILHVFVVISISLIYVVNKF